MSLQKEVQFDSGFKLDQISQWIENFGLIHLPLEIFSYLDIKTLAKGKA